MLQGEYDGLVRRKNEYHKAQLLLVEEFVRLVEDKIPSTYSVRSSYAMQSVMIRREREMSLEVSFTDIGRNPMKELIFVIDTLSCRRQGK